MLGELYDGEFASMEHNGRMDACMSEEISREEIAALLARESMSEDAISRQSLKRQIQLTIEDAVLNGANDVANVLRIVIDFIDGEPSVQPIRPRGHWIRITNGAMKEKYICSECRRQIEDDGIEGLLYIKYPYCHCGADMREANDEA